MNRLSIVTLLALALAPVVALTVDTAGAADTSKRVAPKPVDENGRAEYRIVRLLEPTGSPLGEPKLRQLTRLGFDIEFFGPDDPVAYVSAEEMDKLEALGVNWLELPNDPPSGGGGGGSRATYHNYDSMTAELQQVAADHPNITRLVSAGQTVQGRELWWLRITDNPDAEEDEPGFKYIGTMHGDEKVGTENCMRLIERLTDDYGIDSRITSLVDDVEIWIMPLMNPDGHTSNSRYNASGVDLNRDFPDRIDDPVDSPAGRAPETVAVMTWQDGHTTSLSANFHGGALVVNYPYDNNVQKQSVDTPTPDDDIVRELSLEYSEDNFPMYNGSWPMGITNGADWYVVAGGMQDWNYDYRGTIDTTIELSNLKTPPESQLDGFWSDNEESMLSYMERALTGVRGLVTDAGTGSPLPARLWISGRDVNFYADPDVGDYHRQVPVGSFTLNVTAPGYETRQLPLTITSSTANAQRLDVQLSPLGTSFQHAGDRVATDGSSDGFFDPGEVGTLAVSLENLGGDATSISGELVPVSPHATSSSSANWPDIGAGGEAESTPPHFSIDVDPGAPAGHKLAFAVEWAEGGSGAAGMTDAFFVPLSAPRVAVEPAGDLPQPILDNQTIESSVVVAEDRELYDVNVRVDITHSYIGDLTVTVIHPDGTEVILHDQTGGTTNNINTWYDTDTNPAQSLDALIGKSTAGTWRLRVTDSANGDTGSLVGFSVELIDRQWESPIAEVLLRGVTKDAGGDVTLNWWPVGSATSYRVHRSSDATAEANFSDVTSSDPDATDTTFVDSAAGSIVYYIISADGYTGEGLWGHYGR